MAVLPQKCVWLITLHRLKFKRVRERNPAAVFVAVEPGFFLVADG